MYVIIAIILIAFFFMYLIVSTYMKTDQLVRDVEQIKIRLGIVDEPLKEFNMSDEEIEKELNREFDEDK